MWLPYWKLAHDPFALGTDVYVPLPGHEEAIARLVHLVESGQPRGRLLAPSGRGKSVVVRQFLARVRQPGRRLVLVSGRSEGTALLVGVAEALGRRVPRDGGRSLAWRLLQEGLRLSHWQGQSIVLVVEDWTADPRDRFDPSRLAGLDPRTRLTVLLTGRAADRMGARFGLEPGERDVRLAPLTRAETASYLRARLAAAGGDGAVFTPTAVSEVHARARGNPRRIDRLATLALMAGAVRGLDVIPADVVEDSARECLAL